ncbi:MAG: hypothetical protein IKQ91_04450 [Oscillospiraceae bacterium]|nr:hypothetical protein [Oscillospiraceae bacterium]
MAELRRLLLSPKRLIILLMIAVINLTLFSGYCRAEREQSVSYYNSMKMWGINVQGEEYRKRKDYLEKDYYEYLEYVQNQSQSQSILSKLEEKNDYVDRNTAKTQKDYSRLSGITLKDGENRGVNAVKDYEITDYLLLIAPLLLVLEMLADSDSAAGDLTRSTKQGRVPLCAWRIFAVALLSAASVLVLYGGNLLYTCKFYGNPDFLRSVQSIPAFQVCPLRLTVGGYLFAAGCMKALSLTVFSLLIWVILARFHTVLGWLISGVWVGTSFLLYRLIVPTAKINHLKFLNLFAALDADVFFTNYCNLNWFGHPVGFLGSMLLFCTALLLITAAFCLWLIGYAYPKKVGQSMEALKDRFAKFLTRHLPVHTLFGFEGWKLLAAQKGAILLLITGLMGFSLWQDIRVYVPVNQVTERFYESYSGPVTEEHLKKAAYIVIGEMNSIRRDRIALAKKYLLLNSTEDKAELNQIRRDISRIQANISTEQDELHLYRQLLDSMLSLARFNRKTGRGAWFIQQSAYQVFFHDSAAEHRCCTVLLLYLIFAFSGISAYDNRYDTRMLLRSTKRGRAGIFTAQAIWIALLTALVSAGLHGVYLLHIIQDAGFASPEAPAQSLQMFQWIPFSISLRTCIILFMVLRFLAATAVNAGIYAVSRFSRTPQKALLTAMVIFLLPSALAESGISQLQVLNFVRRLTCCLQ